MPKKSVEILVFPFLFFLLFLSPPFLSSSLSSLLLCSSPQILQRHIMTSAHTIREGTLPLPSVEPQIPEARTKPHCFLSSPVLSLLGDTQARPWMCMAESAFWPETKKWSQGTRKYQGDMEGKQLGKETPTFTLKLYMHGSHLNQHIKTLRTLPRCQTDHWVQAHGTEPDGTMKPLKSEMTWKPEPPADQLVL